MPEKRVFVLFDGRAAGGMGTSDASVICVEENDKDAREVAKEYGQVACYSYRREGKNLVDEQWEWDSV